MLAPTSAERVSQNWRKSSQVVSGLPPSRRTKRASRLGSLEVGKYADLVLFDDQFRVTCTIAGGKVVYRNR